MSECARKITEEEIYNCLKSLNVPVRLSDVKTPTKEFIIRVFECLLKDLHIDIRNPNLRPWEAISHLENPEISEDARMLGLLIISINFFTRQDGIEINIKDITEPKPKRTKKILNYLIVFWNFCLTKVALYESINEGLQEELKKLAKLVEENKSLEEQCNDYENALINKQPTKDELNHSIALNKEKLRQYEKQKETDALEYQNLKKKEHDLKSQVAAADVNIISVKEGINELDQLILTSPERLNVDIHKAKKSIKDVDINIKVKECELKEKVKLLEALKSSQEENIKAVELLKKIEAVNAKFSDTTNKFQTDIQKTKEEEEKVRKLNEELEMKNASRYLYEEKSAKIQLNNKKQVETFSETLQSLQRDVFEEQKSYDAVKATTSELEQKIDKEADTVLEIVDLCYQAETETEKAFVAYGAQLEAISNHFQSDCNDVKYQVKKYFDT